MSAEPLTTAHDFPLAVDLDDTLLKVDTLYENVAYNVFRHPFKTLHALMGLAGGKAAMKERLSKLDLPDASTLPRDPDFIDYLKAQKANGRSIHLVTAAHRTMATHIASDVGVFASAHGTDDQTNLKGTRKAEFLETTFPDGFVYAGDSSADLHVWRKAEAAILVGVSETTQRTVETDKIKVETAFGAPKVNIAAAWLASLGLHRWLVILAILGIVLFAIGAAGTVSTVTVFAGAFLLGCAASGVFLTSELAALETNRKNPSRRNRPFASGALPVRDGLVAAVFLMGVAIAGSVFISPAFSGLMLLLVLVSLNGAFWFVTAPGIKQLMPIAQLALIGALSFVLIGTSMVGA